MSASALATSVRTTMPPLMTASILWDGKQRFFARMQLHIEGRQQGCGARIVAHEQNDIDQLVRSEQRLCIGESCRVHLVVAPDLAAKRDDRRVALVQAAGAAAMLDG